LHATGRSRLLRHSQGDKTKYETYLHSRPRSFEKTAVRMLMEVMQQGVGKPAAPGFGLHIVHLTDSDLLPELAVAKSAGEDCQSDLQVCAVAISYNLAEAARVNNTGQRTQHCRSVRHSRSANCIANDFLPGSRSMLLTVQGNCSRAGVPVTVEVGAHYLVFAAEDIPDGDTHYKCAPPLRERKIVNRLWNGLQVRHGRPRRTAPLGTAS